MSFDIEIRIRRGERDIGARIESAERVVALVGPSGIGKTSVLHAIAGLLQPDEGRIAVGGATLFDSARGIDLPPEARRAGYVFQDSRLFPHLTVERNLAFAASHAQGEASIGQDDLCALLDIAHLLNRDPSALSGGETRRVAIARALLSAPRFLLLDEPLSSLDPERAEAVLTCIERLRDTLAMPMLYVSHSASEVARLTKTIVEMPQAH
ncbi:ATP-binding cassette domain-containing protein [Erythrobacter sp. HKB08]|uniref:ATP-binding cassette domain-containing protein n=1 Tax=Erythrobacter sp. HKB08 TaxID=2502843 RepID=UPI0010087527|nr:ATP-binding cassette domain-containing protein [Erythrobacter sp. HKB08]